MTLVVVVVVVVVRSPNIIRVIESRRIRWAGHVARMEEGTSHV